MPMPQAVAIPMAMSAIKDGVYTANEAVGSSAKAMLEALSKWSVALKTMR